MDRREITEPMLQRLLAANAVLPEQFWSVEGSATERSGEQALMWAVLADGIECYRRNAHAASLQQRSEFLEAEAWIFSTDWDWPFSFVNLCEAFGFDPAAVREVLERWKHKRTGKAVRRQRFRPVTLHAA
ncbi:MAG: hypothetical protein ACE5I7_10535 [Candidatus Binatia bacterium]